jgi:hypothetical protein
MASLLAMNTGLLYFGAHVVALTTALLMCMSSAACYLLGRLSYAVPTEVQVHFRHLINRGAFIMKRSILATAFLSLVVVATAKADSPVTQRARYWQQRLDRELPLGSARTAVLDWTFANHFQVSEDPKTHDLIIGLEDVPDPTAKSRISASPIVCKDWHISAAFKMDAKGQLGSTTVQTIGNCL